MTDRPTSTCCTCGYSWPTGQDGSHSCSQLLKERLDALQVRYDSCHAELLAIHIIGMCVAECPKTGDNDTLTVRLVRSMANEMNRCHDEDDAAKNKEFVEIPFSDKDFRLIAASVLEGLAQDAARIGAAKGFDQGLHRTQITLIATEIAEALEHVSASKSYHVDLATVRLAQCMDLLRQYQREAIEHVDLSRIGNRAKMIEELADVVLRVLTYVGGNGWSQEFAAALLDKNDANRDRPRLHGRAF